MSIVSQRVWEENGILSFIDLLLNAVLHMPLSDLSTAIHILSKCD